MSFFEDRDLGFARRALIAMAGEIDWERALSALGGGLTGVVADPRCRVPHSYVVDAIARDDRDRIVPLLLNDNMSTSDLAAVRAAALPHLDDPEVFEALVLGRSALPGQAGQTRSDLANSWDEEERRRDLVAAATGPAAVAAFTVMPRTAYPLLYDAVNSPEPEVVRHALNLSGPKLSVTRQIEGIRSIQNAGCTAQATVDCFDHP